MRRISAYWLGAAAVGTGEVRSSMLGYMYGIRQADGTMMEDCCEDDLMPMGEE